MTSVILAIRLLAASQLLLFCIGLVRSENPPNIRWSGVLFAVTAIGYLMAPLVDPQTSVETATFLGLLASSVPATLLLFTWNLFEDRPAPAWLWGIVAGFVLSYATLLVTMQLNVDAVWLWVFQVSKLALVAMSAFIIYRGADSDLLEPRRAVRWWLCIAIVVIVVSIVAAELVMGFQVPGPVELFGMAVIFAFALGFNARLMQMAPVFSGAPNTSGEENKHVHPETDDPLLRALLNAMTVERRYADHDLRIASLAKELGTQEHVLRRSINQGLGFNNFNQFINSYRIAEASRRFQEGEQSPILTIALDVGFRSISSFNTAFRAAHGCSPTVYRENAAEIRK